MAQAFGSVNSSTVIGTATDAAPSWLSIAQNLGSPIKAGPWCNLENLTAAFTLLDTTMYFCTVYLPVDATITGVAWHQAANGAYTGDENNRFGLYTVGATPTLVASTTNDANLWTGATNAWRQKAFSSTYAATAGVYMVAGLYNYSAQTTAPTIRANTAVGNASIGAPLTTTNYKLWGNNSPYTDLQATHVWANINTATNGPAWFLY